MASRKMTFTVRVIAAKLRERDERMIRSCEAANGNADVLAIERDWDAASDKADRVEEPWTIA